MIFSGQVKNVYPIEITKLSLSSVPAASYIKITFQRFVNTESNLVLVNNVLAIVLYTFICEQLLGIL